MKPSIYIILIAAIATGIFHVLPANAATLDVTADPTAAIGQPFQVGVALDTQGDDANAIQGEIVFPPNLFTLEAINDGSSPVSLWIEPPHETSSGTIVFSGIVPGGFKGETNSVFGAILVPTGIGTGVIDIENVQLLRNDGQGSVIPLTTAGQTVVVGSTATSPGELTTPSTTPQKFTPIVSHSPDVYGGKYFLVFSTTDKGSGINHYDVLEMPSGASLGGNPAWITATSPYLLKDQSLSSDIYVRAVNNEGGAIIMKIPARFPYSAATQFALFGFALLVALAILWIGFVIYRRRQLHPPEL
jgi:hypothetical protein